MDVSTLAVLDAEGKDRKAFGLHVAEKLETVDPAPRRQRTRTHLGVALRHGFGADGVLDEEGQRCADIANHVGRSAFLAHLKAVAVVVVRGRDELPRATTR